MPNLPTTAEIYKGHIIRGYADDCHECPTALALCEAYMHAGHEIIEISVDYSHSKIEIVGQEEVTYRHESDLHQWIEDFDSWGQPSDIEDRESRAMPITLKLDHEQKTISVKQDNLKMKDPPL